MGKLLDELTAEMDEHPEWDDANQALVTKMAEGDFLETFSGKVFAYLQEKGEREGVSVRFEEQALGRKLFFYGDEVAVLQIHIAPSGLARSYTPIIDLQKPWWREAFLEHGEGGQLENVGLISPSVAECLNANFAQDEAQKLQIYNILRAIGQDPGDVGGEYVEHVLYGPSNQGVGSQLMAQLQPFWRPVVAPHFDIQFNSGGGDLFRKLRLVPLTQEGQEALLSGGDMVRQVLGRIIGQYDELISFLKE